MFEAENLRFKGNNNLVSKYFGVSDSTTVCKTDER